MLTALVVVVVVVVNGLKWTSTINRMISSLSLKEQERLFRAVDLDTSASSLAKLLAYPAYDFMAAYRGSCGHHNSRLEDLFWLQNCDNLQEAKETLLDIGCLVHEAQGKYHIVRNLLEAGMLPKYLLHEQVDVSKLDPWFLSQVPAPRVLDGRWCRRLKIWQIDRCPWSLMTVECLEHTGPMEMARMIRRLLQGIDEERAPRILLIYLNRVKLQVRKTEVTEMEDWLNGCMRRLAIRFESSLITAMESRIFDTGLLAPAQRLLAMLTLTFHTHATWMELLQVTLMVEGRAEWIEEMFKQVDLDQVSPSSAIAQFPEAMRDRLDHPNLLKLYLRHGHYPAKLSTRVNGMLWQHRTSLWHRQDELRWKQFRSQFTSLPFPYLNLSIKGYRSGEHAILRILRQSPVIDEEGRIVMGTTQRRVMIWAKAMWHYWLYTGFRLLDWGVRVPSKDFFALIHFVIVNRGGEAVDFDLVLFYGPQPSSLLTWLNRVLEVFSVEWAPMALYLPDEDEAFNTLFSPPKQHKL